jgi:hypothetical protein
VKIKFVLVPDSVFLKQKFGETFPVFIFLSKLLKIANKCQSEYYFSQKGLEGCKL